MANIEIDGLEIVIGSSSKDASQKVDSLTASLKALRDIIKGNVGKKLTELAESLVNFAEKMKSIPELKNFYNLTKALERIKGVDLKGLSAFIDSQNKPKEEQKKKKEVSKDSFAAYEERKQMQPYDPFDKYAFKNIDIIANIKSKFESMIASIEAKSPKAAKAINILTTPLKLVNKLVNGLGKVAKNSSPKIKEFFKAGTRIAGYRFIRFLINAITAALKEGINNFYQYSKAMNGTFAKAMDNLATKWKTLKNSIGVLLATLIEKLEPIISGLMQMLTGFINTAAGAIQILFGSADKVYTATEAWTEYASAVNETKKALTGFDEINSLSGANGTSYTDMFKMTNVTQDMLDMADGIKNFWNSVVDWFTKAKDTIVDVFDKFKYIIDKLYSLLSWGDTKKYQKAIEDSSNAIEAVQNITKEVAKSEDPTGEIITNVVGTGVKVGFSYLWQKVKKWFNNLGFDNVKSVSGYATGGFPEDGLFFANHSEMVGKFSNGKTAVANNDQIVSGIKQGVYEAMVESGGANNGGTIVVQVVEDGKVKAEKIISELRRYNNSVGKTVIAINS